MDEEEADQDVLGRYVLQQLHSLEVRRTDCRRVASDRYKMVKCGMCLYNDAFAGRIMWDSHGVLRLIRHSRVMTPCLEEAVQGQASGRLKSMPVFTIFTSYHKVTRLLGAKEGPHARRHGRFSSSFQAAVIGPHSSCRRPRALEWERDWCDGTRAEGEQEGR